MYSLNKVQCFSVFVYFVVMAACTFLSTQPANATAGPVAAYSFNEGVGKTAVDSSGFGNNGSITNPSWTTSGKYGKALTFGANNRRVTVPDSNVLDLTAGMTLSAWVYPTSNRTGWDTIILKEQPGNMVYSLYMNYSDTKSAGYIYSGGAEQEIISSNTLTLNTWTYVTLTYDGTALKIYHNGVLRGTVNYTGTMPVSNGALSIGGNSIWTNEYFPGRIDEVRIYDRALSAAEITTDMNTPVPSTPIVDTTAPVTNITNPINNSTVSGTVIVSATATDNVGVSAFDFLVDNTVVKNCGAVTSCTYSWNTLGYSNAAHNILARARDAANNLGSSTVNVTVLNIADTQPPVVNLTSPQAGSTQSGAVIIGATATDNIGVTSFQLLIDNNVVKNCGAVTSCTYSWNTTLFANGTHTVLARANDLAGNQGTTTIDVAVLNVVDTEPPAINITSPIANTTQTGTVIIGATVLDNIGVSVFNILIDNSVVKNCGAVTSCTHSWDTSLSVNGTHNVSVNAIDTASNVSNSSVLVDVYNSAPVQVLSLLHVSASNPRYFEDANGNIQYLTGSHTWDNLVDTGTGPTQAPAMNYTSYLDFLDNYNHNFFRLWAWEQVRWSNDNTFNDFWYTPSPYLRVVGSGTALDGQNKFDLTQFNQDYFDRLRQRVLEAGSRGKYVAVIMFNGWSIESCKGSFCGSNPWRGHPFNSSNNINSINGDPSGNNSGEELHKLMIPEVTSIQEAYVRKVIDSINDLDNVLYEISNESDGNATDWQYHFINYIKSYEQGKAKQHPVGMTVEWPNGSNQDLLNSNADWVSFNGDVNNPPIATGAKVVIADTDHLCGICGTPSWVAKSFTRGENPIWMDIYDVFGSMHLGGGYNYNDANAISMRIAMGKVRNVANKMNLKSAIPYTNLSTSGYTLADLASPQHTYATYDGSGSNFNVNLSATTGSLSVEWTRLADGVTYVGTTIPGGALRSFTPPAIGEFVLFLKKL